MAIRADRLSFGKDALATVTPVAFAKSGRLQRLNEAQAANTTIEGGVLGYHVSGASGIPDVRWGDASGTWKIECAALFHGSRWISF